MSKKLTFQKPQKKTDGYTLLPTGAKQIKIWKPNLIQKFMYWTRIMKDPRYNGKKINYYLHDEAGQWDGSTCR